MQWHHIHTYNAEHQFVTCHHILLGETKHNMIRGGHDLHHTAHLVMGGGGVAIYLYSEIICLLLIISSQKHV